MMPVDYHRPTLNTPRHDAIESGSATAAGTSVEEFNDLAGVPFMVANEIAMFAFGGKTPTKASPAHIRAAEPEPPVGAGAR